MQSAVAMPSIECDRHNAPERARAPTSSLRSSLRKTNMFASEDVPLVASHNAAHRAVFMTRARARWVLLTCAALALGLTCAFAPEDKGDVPAHTMNSLSNRIARALRNVREIRSERTKARKEGRARGRRTRDGDASSKLGFVRPHMIVPPMDEFVGDLLSDIDFSQPWPRDERCEIQFKSPTMGICHCLADNAGDLVGPAIVRKVVEYHFKGCSAEAVPELSTSCFGAEQGDCLLVVGSVLEKAKAGDHVWGTGTWHENSMQDVWKHAGAVLHGVRGPATAGVLRRLYLSPENDALDVPAIGDPGFLISFTHAYMRDDAQPNGRCFIAHHYDNTQQPQGVKLISTHNGWKQMVRDILGCEYIFTSSLHGLIFAESFGIPARWYQPKGGMVEKAEGVWKYLDWIRTTPRDDKWHTPSSDINEIWNEEAYPPVFTAEQKRAIARKLVARFPYDLFKVVRPGESTF